jgi:hypothetical protein
MSQAIDTLRIKSMPKPEIKLQINLETENSRLINEVDEMDYKDANDATLYSNDTTINVEKFGENELNNKIINKKIKNIKKTFSALNENEDEDEYNIIGNYRVQTTAASCEKKIEELVRKAKTEED